MGDRLMLETEEPNDIDHSGNERQRPGASPYPSGELRDQGLRLPLSGLTPELSRPASGPGDGSIIAPAPRPRSGLGLNELLAVNERPELLSKPWQLGRVQFKST